MESKVEVVCPRMECYFNYGGKCSKERIVMSARGDFPACVSYSPVKAEEKRVHLQDIEFLMKERGFKEASNIVKDPIVPGAHGADTFWWREFDNTFVQISYWHAMPEEGYNEQGYILRFKKNYKAKDKAEYQRLSDKEPLTLAVMQEFLEKLEG